jgi:hypothetical protein
MRLEGTFMKVDVRNSNGHIYKAEAIQDALEEYKKKVDAGEAFGILGDAREPERSFNNDIGEISHMITDVSLDASSGNIFCKIELLDTPNGRIAKELINAMGEIDVAPSMLVEPNENGEYDVVQIQSFDFCKESAWPDAKVKPIE